MRKEFFSIKIDEKKIYTCSQKNFTSFETADAERSEFVHRCK